MAARQRLTSPTYTASVAEVSRVLGWMPQVIRSEGLTDWERQFCASMIARHKKRPSFTPTDKQVGIMQRLVGDFQRAALGTDAEATSAVAKGEQT